MTVPTGLRVEHLDEPLGLTVSTPRLSWRLPAGTRQQHAYQIRAGRWDSGRVDSDESLLVPYAGPALTSGERVEWGVKVWTDAGESAWAEPGWWEMGLLHQSDWVARWVRPPGGGLAADRPQPVWHLRGTCDVTEPVRRARLYATAHGLYELFLNGVRVGDLELTPGFTSYRSRLQVQVYDVTNLLRQGENVLAAVVSGGWLSWAPIYHGEPLGLLAQLVIHDGDGQLSRFGTGADWTASTGAIRTADLQQGQIVDLRRQPSGWSAVVTKDVDAAILASSPAPPVRRVEELRPVSITRPAPDRYVVDLGQNINGWVRLSNLGPAGTTVTLTHGEALDAAGDVTLDHLAGTTGVHQEPFQRDEVTSAGREGEVFEPRHTTHGFRYVRVEGHPGPLTDVDVTGVVVHTDLRRTGWFECSDERVNKLHEAVVWSFRDNAVDVPTDCPTRERAGWTGDWQIFVPTAAFLYDVAGFSEKWLRDLATEQGADGIVGHFAPAAQGPIHHPFGSAGWGDAAVLVPWTIYRAYGDRDLLEQQWPSMTAWIGYAAGWARDRRHATRIAARPEPAAHEQYLWDTGFHWGEWLEPDALVRGGDSISVDELYTADHGSVATAYLSHSAHIVARIARLLGRDDGAHTALADAARSAWQQEFLGPDGVLSPDSQATCVRALAFDLVPERLRPVIARRLVELIRKVDTHLGTGFLATAQLLPVLADNGHLDLAYELLLQDTEPSWLTMIERGATTVWEHWSGLDENGLPGAPAGVGSLNHYSKGAVVAFLHQYVAGIQSVEPGYRRFAVAPRPGGGLSWARGRHDCPYGLIESAWRIDEGTFVLDVTVPPGTTAAVRLPDGQVTEIGPGTHRLHCPVPPNLTGGLLDQPDDKAQTAGFGTDAAAPGMMRPERTPAPGGTPCSS